MTLHHVYLRAFVLTSLFTFAGCRTAPQPEQKRDIASDLAAISALGDKVTAAIKSNDAAALAATYADDAIMMDPNQAAIEGRQAIQAAFETRYKEYATKIASFTFVLTPIETQVAGDWAYQRGNYTVNVTPKSGEPMEHSFKYLNIYRRQPDGSWKTYRDISNTNNPPSVTKGKKK